MSGIEVAGLILGVIPLVISGMEHYADGVSTLGRYRKYKLELKTLINILDTERTKLMNTCDKLLIGLAPPWKIEAMIEDPFGEMWRDAEMQKRIRVRLWRSSKVFDDTMENVHAAIREMVGRLGLQPDGKVQWVEGSAIVRELKRATFSLKKASYDDLLARIKDGIASLETLASQNVDLEPKRKMRSQGRLLSILREILKSVYRALEGSLTCHGAHDLNLELERRSADFIPQDEDEDVAKELSFRIAISSHLAPEVDLDRQPGELMQFWDEVVVREITMPKSPVPAPASPSPSPAGTQKGKGKSVAFFLSPLSTLASSTSTMALTQRQTATTLAPAKAASIVGGASEIPSNPGTLTLNLCETLREAKKQQLRNCYGHVADSWSLKRREYGIYRSGKAADAEKWSIISLRQVLKHSTKELPPLTYRDRLHLAVVISSSVLQIHQTPWLSGHLRSEDVIFIQRGNVPLYEHVFVARRVPEFGHAKAGYSTRAASIGHNPAMLSLGILLIELILGKPIHETNKPEYDFLADYVTAQKLLNEVDQWGGPNYGSAVRRCLNSHSYLQNLSFEDERFRQDMYCGVVALLEQDLANALGKKLVLGDWKSKTSHSGAE